jgi:hypothetical protein
MVYKTPEGGRGAFCLGTFCFGGFFWALAWEGFLDFGLVLLLWAFWCGKLLEGKRITAGKRIAKEKRITEGKRMAKEGLIESLHQEL